MRRGQQDGEESTGGHSKSISQVHSVNSKRQSPLLSVYKYVAAKNDDQDDNSLTCSASKICISNVTSANNFKTKVLQIKKINRSILKSMGKSPSQSYFIAGDKSERSPPSKIANTSGIRLSTGRKQGEPASTE